MKSRRRIRDLLDNTQMPETVAKELKSVLENKKEVLPGWTPSFLKKLGDIKTVIDVGVLEGTPSLYQAYPDAKLYLVEALPSYTRACESLIKMHPGGGEVFMCAAGDSDGKLMIRYYKDLPARSSALTTVGDNKMEATEVEVPLKRLDTIFAGKDLAGDVLLKIDVEGMEYKVIEGASALLKKVKYCITETSIKNRHNDSYRFADFIALMKKNGFDLYDVLTVTRAKSMQPRASIMDAVFINSAMLKDAL